MKKYFALFLCVLLALGVLCSCTSSPAPASDADERKVTEAPSAAPTEAIADTTAPTEEAPDDFDEAAAVEAALPIISRISEVNGCSFDTEAAECSMSEYDDGSGKMFTISVPDRDRGGTLFLDLYLSPSGEYSIPFSGISYASGYHNVDDNRWRETFGAEPITVTPGDIAASGCTATEGDEYMRAVYEIFAEKAAERLTGAEDGVPARCIEAVPVYCEPDEDHDGTYMVKLAVVPADLYWFARFCDGGVPFCGEDFPEEYYCRAIFLGRPILTRESDGSWTGSLNWDIGA